MTDQEQQRAISEYLVDKLFSLGWKPTYVGQEGEVIGWTIKTPRGKCYNFYYTTREEAIEGFIRHISDLHNYIGNLQDLQNLILLLPAEKWTNYIQNLLNVVGLSENMFLVYNAKIAQRREAFLKTISRWKL